ncbi:MAG: class I SAM-dependent methyltransferase [Eubacterium sp.]|nr:class I SAM-dependent methyltransferase [Eubacterium sp.]
MLSERLKAIAGMVSEGKVVADIGTDHGYMVIELVKSGKCEKAIAMDINKGPLERAKAHIEENGLSKCIITRLSNGFSNLEKGEASSAVIAGMGGKLICGILTEGKEIAKELDEIIISPQSDIRYVRETLLKESFKILDEDMVKEDGKYYNILKIRYMPMENEDWDEVFLTYGKILTEKKNPVFKSYLKYEENTLNGILSELEKSGQAKDRYREIKEKALVNKKAQIMTEMQFPG